MSNVNLEAVRQAVAEYMYSEGCSCCRDIDAHEVNKKRLAELLNVPLYSDGSGYDFSLFRINAALQSEQADKVEIDPVIQVLRNLGDAIAPGRR